MATLAIKGHATRGREVIEILEMLGGKNDNFCRGTLIENIYLINEYNCIEGYHLSLYPNHIKFTLEQFLEKFPYKVGDKVNSKYLKKLRIVKMEWEGSNNRVIYKLKGYGWYSSNELQPYKEETMEENSVVVNNEHKQLKVHSLRYDKVQLMIDDKYELKQEGNAYYIVKKQPQYPKTYKACCDILGVQSNLFLQLKSQSDGDEVEEKSYGYAVAHKMNALYELIICRDAYWKMAGDWEPDWTDNKTDKYIITNFKNEIVKDLAFNLAFKAEKNSILAFPTAEMRDAFYENFKELINECKELL